MKFRRLLLATFAVVIVSGLAQAKSSDDLSADEVIAKADEGRIPPGPLTVETKIEDYEKDEKVHETKYKIYVGADINYSLTDTIAPERQKGRKLLMDHDSIWLYTPDVKRAVRVSLQQRLTGEISNGDLSRTNFAGDYDGEMIDKQDLDGRQAYHMMLKAKRSTVMYAKIEYWVWADDFLPAQAVFYALSGKKIKTGLYSEPKVLLGHKRISKTKFSSAVDAKRSSVMSYQNFKKATIPKSFFNKEGLGDR